MTRSVEVEGAESAADLHVGVAVASWNEAITGKLLEAAIQRLEALDAAVVTVLRVPGALELPLAAKSLIDKGCDAVVAIGIVIKGETDHYEIVVRESTAGVARVAIDAGVPVTNAILAVQEYEHAVDRAGPGPSNKGVEAVDAAVRMATAIKELGRG